jgi:hypothetical protein
MFWDFYIVKEKSQVRLEASHCQMEKSNKILKHMWGKQKYISEADTWTQNIFSNTPSVSKYKMF